MGTSNRARRASVPRSSAGDVGQHGEVADAVAEASAVELTADARLALAGQGITSELTLRRIRFGIAGSPLRIGTTLAGDFGIQRGLKNCEPLKISRLRSPTTIFKAFRASRSASVSWKLVCASCRSVVVRDRYATDRPVRMTTKARTIISAAALDAALREGRKFFIAL